MPLPTSTAAREKMPREQARPAGAERRAQSDLARPPGDADRHQREDPRRREEQTRGRRPPPALRRRPSAARPLSTPDRRARRCGPGAGRGRVRPRWRERVAPGRSVSPLTRTPMTAGYTVAAEAAWKTYGASPRSVGVMPMSRTIPTISNHGSGAAGSAAAYRTRRPTGVAPSSVSACERLVHEHRARARLRGRPRGSRVRPRSVSRTPRRSRVRPTTVQRFRIEHRCGSRRRLELGPPHRRRHAGQAVGERDRHDAWFLRDAPFELAVRLLDPPCERRRRLFTRRGRRRFPIQLDADGQILAGRESRPDDPIAHRFRA